MWLLDKLKRKPNRKTLRRLYVLWTICGPVALVFTLVANERISALPDPNPVDVPKETALETKASRFGHDYLILWLAGDKDLQSRIDEVSNIPGGCPCPQPRSVSPTSRTSGRNSTTANPTVTETGSSTTT